MKCFGDWFLANSLIMVDPRAPANRGEGAVPNGAFILGPLGNLSLAAGITGYNMVEE